MQSSKETLGAIRAYIYLAVGVVVVVIYLLNR
jgi:hypothetical protein